MSQYYSRPGMRELKQAYDYLSSQPEFANNNVVFVVVRRYGDLYEFEFYLRTQTDGYRVRVLCLPNQQYTITQFSRIQTQSLTQPVYTYAAVKSAAPVKLAEVRNNKGFAASVSVLMRGYSHFLVSPQIKDILVTQN